ncbi:GAF domain-containing protein [Antrihabitans cavernicola]|nr:GAF domain-containing protein [Spelaeibacter cavernicola]
MGSTRSEFVEGTTDGNAAISMVERDDHRLCIDVVTEPPPGWNDKKRDYRTFVSVPVVAGGVAYGMLTVDALEPGDLDENDANVLRVLAGLLAVALDTDR